MKQRAISALGVVVVGLVPAIMGGPIWAIALAILCTIGFHEYHQMAKRLSPTLIPFGYVLVPLFAVATYVDRGDQALIGLAALSFVLPLVAATFRSNLDGAFVDFGLASAGSLYLGLPLYAAIKIRELDGTVSAGWLGNLADRAALDWTSAERGLAWLVTVILVTWLSDTFAYLVGRQFGKRPLTPVVSPKKTVEGFVGGLVAAALTGAIAFRVFGINDRWWLGIIVGIVLAIVALYGDLSESVLKRQAGVKDSSSLIPGHGGMLDRLDALLFTFIAGWYLALLTDRYFS
jgi:phosphatidate cytidylyltransferase